MLLFYERKLASLKILQRFQKERRGSFLKADGFNFPKNITTLKILHYEYTYACTGI